MREKIVIVDSEELHKKFKHIGGYKQPIEDIKVMKTLIPKKPECTSYTPIAGGNYVKQCSTCTNGNLCFDIDSASHGSFGTAYYECRIGIKNEDVLCNNPNVKRTYVINGKNELMYPSEYRKLISN